MKRIASLPAKAVSSSPGPVRPRILLAIAITAATTWLGLVVYFTLVASLLTYV